MKPFTLVLRLTGISLFVVSLVSCSTSRNSSAPFTASIEGVRVITQNKSTALPVSTGPDIMAIIPPAVKNEVVETNVEKGGKITYLAPSWAKTKPESGITYYADAEVLQQANALKEYALQHAYDTGYAFLVNMSLKSGKKRFYVVNLQTMAIANSGLVAHGRGEERFAFDKHFSNSPGSNCTSLGRYKIGKSYEGQFGLAYKLHGLDSTNNNAFKRFVVLHAMGCISYDETNEPICQSEGCPAVAPQFLEEIQPLIDSRKMPMLLWVFNSGEPATAKTF